MKKSKRPRREWSPEDKAHIVREYQRSGESISGLARRRQLAVSSLRNWIEIRGENQAGSAAFVELIGLMPEPARGEYHYVLSLASGHTLRLRRGFDSREVQAQALAVALASNA